MTFLRIVIRSIFLFEHDLRAHAFRVCREGKPVSTFPDHALKPRASGINRSKRGTPNPMPDRIRLDGKVAVVTGAAGVIGRATIQLLAERGARIVAGDRKRDELEAAIKD